jgi:hypothetical protein
MDPYSQNQPQPATGGDNLYTNQAMPAPAGYPQPQAPNQPARQDMYAPPQPTQPYQQLPPTQPAVVTPKPSLRPTMPQQPATPYNPPQAPQQMPQPIAVMPQQQPMQSAQPVVSAPGVMQKATVKPAQSNPNSTQNSLQIAEIRDGIVIMNDGSYRSVIMAKSINFDLMSPQEQEAVEYSYQGFLNSLYFPIQIFVRSQKVDLQPYLEKLDKIRSEHDNMLLALLMEDYINYMTQLSAQTNIMDKKFYIVIPYFPHVDVQKAITQSKNFFTGLAGLFDKKEQHVVINEAELEKAKTELRNRVQAVLGGMLQTGIQALPLDTQELIELYYDTYNPDTATRQELKNFGNMTADIVTKGSGNAAQPHLQKELS